MCRAPVPVAPQVVLSGSAGDAVLRAPARSGPAAMLGYYRPPLTSYEGVVLEVLSDVLAGACVLTYGCISIALVSCCPLTSYEGVVLEVLSDVLAGGCVLMRVLPCKRACVSC